MNSGSDAQAAAYIQIETGPRRTFFGAAIENNTELAAIKAVLSALNRAENAMILAQKR